MIYLSSFSKVLMPGLRIGLLAPPPHLLDILIATKRLSDIQSPQLTQRVLALYLRTPHWSANVRTVWVHYRERPDVMLAHLRQSFPAEVQWSRPAGGLSLWVELPPGVRSVDLYLAALERRVAFAPGEAFIAEAPAISYFRLSYGRQTPELIARGIGVLGELVHEHVARAPRAAVGRTPGRGNGVNGGAMCVRIVQVDAFTDRPFAGNPAAVCLLPEERPAQWMQDVAREMNLPETVFLVKQADGYRLRWFTAAVEDELCGQ